MAEDARESEVLGGGEESTGVKRREAGPVALGASGTWLPVKKREMPLDGSLRLVCGMMGALERPSPLALWPAKRRGGDGDDVDAMRPIIWW